MSINNLILLALVAISGISDLYTGKIRNVFTYPAVVIGLLLSFLLPDGIGLKNSSLGLLVGFAPLFMINMAGGLGGGDVKLLAAIGALKGYPFILYSVFYSFLVGAGMATVLLIKERRWLVTMQRISRTLYTALYPGLKMEPLETTQSTKIRFGFAICFGTLWSLALELIL